MSLMGKEHCFNFNMENKKINKAVFGTTEWAVCNANFLNGCSNDCKYCYSKEMAIRFKRKTPHNWKDEEINKDALNRKFNHKDGYIMFPSTHDITPIHLSNAINFLKSLLCNNNDVLIVTKPNFECVQKICDSFTSYRDHILFRFTVGSADSNVLKFWEPNAPSYEERRRAIVYAYEHGYKTSLSCEPMLDDNIDAVVSDLQDFVTDSIWLGKMNFVLRRLKANGYDDPQTQKAASLILLWQSDNNILRLYERFKDNPKIKWKESIKKVVGLEISMQKGEDM